MERKKFINSNQEEFSLLNLTDKKAKDNFLFFHATGFNALTYKVLLEGLFKNLNGSINIYAPDLRGHGMSKANNDPALLTSWSVYIEDCLEWVDSIDGDIIVSGHSMGAIVASRIAQARPDRVKNLILLEPVLFSPFNSLKFRLMSKLKFKRSSEMVSGASRRRYKFGSQNEIIESYEGRGAFKTWDRPWIENYVEGGSKENSLGETVLTCHPSWESKTFGTSAMDNWKFLKLIDCSCYALSGGLNSTFSEPSRKALSALGANWKLDHFPNATHFLPMEETENLIDLIINFMSK